MSLFYILDIFPILALIGLIIAVVIKRRAMKEEEKELKETLESFAVKERSNENQ